jgi:FkbM family methyltransferase
MVQKMNHAPVIVDVGAHHGAYAIVLGKLVRERGGKIIAVEPDPDSFAVLEENVRLNGLRKIVICERAAISDRTGQACFIANASEGHISGSRSSQDGCLVDTFTLAEMLKKHAIAVVDLLMIDVEGAELPVLRSFPWSDVKVEKIMCELHPYAWGSFGYSSGDMQYFLRDHKIRCYDMYFQKYDEFPAGSYIGPAYFEFEP